MQWERHRFLLRTVLNVAAFTEGQTLLEQKPLLFINQSVLGCCRQRWTHAVISQLVMFSYCLSVPGCLFSLSSDMELMCSSMSLCISFIHHQQNPENSRLKESSLHCLWRLLISSHLCLSQWKARTMGSLHIQDRKDRGRVSETVRQTWRTLWFPWFLFLILQIRGRVRDYWQTALLDKFFNAKTSGTWFLPLVPSSPVYYLRTWINTNKVHTCTQACSVLVLLLLASTHSLKLLAWMVTVISLMSGRRTDAQLRLQVYM